MKKRYAALLCTVVVGTVGVINAPAAWLAPVVKHVSQGTVSLAQSWGTVWRGSALIKLHRSDKEVLNIPQPLAWTLDLSQLINLRARLDVSSAALQAPITVQLDSKLVRASAGQYSLPADSLNTLGAPFNTLKSTGQIAVKWADFEVSTADNTPPAVPVTVSVQNLRMGLTGDEVLGNYVLDAKPLANNRWAIILSTINPAQAALQLKGSGHAGLNGAPQFELESKATASPAPPRLQTLLNFLGRRQGEVYVLRIN
jgi:hypothetical protein